MIKLEIKNEASQEIPEKIVVFEFRRHKQHQQPSKSNLLYLVVEDPSVKMELYPIKIDGNTKTITFRKDILEKLGFSVIIEQDSLNSRSCY